MQYRSLGKTGIQVSPYALGAMMFGLWAIPTTRSRPDDPQGPRGRNQLHRHRRPYSAGESEEIVGKAMKAAGTTSCSPPRSGADGR